jgi:hypothetical protein
MMPTPVIVLQPSLTDDAHSRIHLSNWKKSLATAAQSLCRTLDDSGAYSLVSEDSSEWQSHPTNIISTTSDAGTLTSPIALALSSPSRHFIWKLKRSRLSLTSSTTRSYNGKNGHQPAWHCIKPCCRQLLAHITTIFGALHASDVFFIENHIKEQLTSFAAFRDFISCNSLNYDIVAKIPHQISEITKIHWLENSLQRCPQFDIPIGTWKSTNTSVATRTYNDLVTCLLAQYSSLSPDTPSRGGKAFNASSSINPTNDGQGRNRKRRRGKGKGKGDAGKGKGQNDNGQSGNNKRQRQQDKQAHAVIETADEPDIEYRNGSEEDPVPTAIAGQLHQWTNTPSVSSTGSDTRPAQPKTADHRFYCAVHGYNITHNGINCKTMLRDP